MVGVTHWFVSGSLLSASLRWAADIIHWFMYRPLSLAYLRWSGSWHSLGCVRTGLGSSKVAGKPRGTRSHASGAKHQSIVTFNCTNDTFCPMWLVPFCVCFGEVRSNINYLQFIISHIKIASSFLALPPEGSIFDRSSVVFCSRASQQNLNCIFCLEERWGFS